MSAFSSGPGRALEEQPLPEHLIDEILRGQCVAFVGAGFSAAANFPNWSGLLRGAIKQAQEIGKLPRDDNDELIASLYRLIDRGSAEAYDRVAQMLQDALEPGLLQDLLVKQLEMPDPLPPQMRLRLRMLSKIPFRAIITTNYDNCIPGNTVFTDARSFREVLRPCSDAVNFGVSHFFRPDDLPEGEDNGDSAPPNGGFGGGGDGSAAGGVPAMLSSLRSPRRSPRKSSFSSSSSTEFRVPVLQIHGSVKDKSSIVCSRLSYRRLLNFVPGYSEFLSALMASCTILYIGFSFTDGYLNDVRSKVISMLDGQRAVLSSVACAATTPTPLLHLHRNTPASYGSGSPSSSPTSRLHSGNAGGGMSQTDSPGVSASQQHGHDRQGSSGGGRPGSPPLEEEGEEDDQAIAYAIIPDQSVLDAQYIRRHEGVHTLTWDSLPHEPPHRRDWSGLDRYLARIYERTSFVHRLGALLSGRRLLVYEPREMMTTTSRPHLTFRELKKRILAAVKEYEQMHGGGGGGGGQQQPAGGHCREACHAAEAGIHSPSHQEEKACSSCREETRIEIRGSFAETIACLEEQDPDRPFDAILTVYDHACLPPPPCHSSSSSTISKSGKQPGEDAPLPLPRPMPIVTRPIPPPAETVGSPKRGRPAPLSLCKGEASGEGTAGHEGDACASGPACLTLLRRVRGLDEMRWAPVVAYELRKEVKKRSPQAQMGPEQHHHHHRRASSSFHQHQYDAEEQEEVRRRKLFQRRGGFEYTTSFEGLVLVLARLLGDEMGWLSSSRPS